MRNENYNYLYHVNTLATDPNRKYAAMTQSGVPHYFNQSEGEWFTAKTRKEAIVGLNALMEAKRATA